MQVDIVYTYEPTLVRGLVHLFSFSKIMVRFRESFPWHSTTLALAKSIIGKQGRGSSVGWKSLLYLTKGPSFCLGSCLSRRFDQKGTQRTDKTCRIFIR